MKYPHIMQHDERDCGAACLAMVASYYGLKLPLGRVRELVQTDSSGTTIFGIVKGAEKLGMCAVGRRGTFEDLVDSVHHGEFYCPIIAHIVNDKQMTHFVVIFELKDKYLKIGDPAKGILKVPVEEFLIRWTGYVISLKTTSTFRKGNFIKKSMQRYVDNVAKEKFYLGLIIFFSIIIAGINMFSATLFEYIVDGLYKSEGQEIIKQNVQQGILSLFFSNIPSFQIIFTLVIGLYIVQYLVQYIRGIVSINVTKRINLPVSLQYYTKLTRLPISFFSGRKIGELLTRFNDASNVCQMIVDTIFTVFVDGVLLIFYSLFLYYINPQLFICVLAILSIFALLVFILKKRIKYLEMISMKKNADVNSYLKESLEGMETVKAYNMEKSVRAKTIDLVEKSVDINCKIEKLNNLQGALVGCIISLAVVLLLWRGMYFVDKGIISIGNLIAFYTMLGSFFTPVQNILNLQVEIQSTFIVADRLNDVMELSIESSGKEEIHGENLFKNDISVCDVTFRYGTREVVLHDTNLHIHNGSKVAIVGESGSGKSTLAKLLAGFYSPESGNIMVGNIKLSELSCEFLREHVTYITQSVYLFSGTIRENLVDATHSSEKELKKVEENSFFLKKFPLGLETIVEENGKNLSGGQKQLISFFRAVLRKPKILILDEVTSNLDPLTEKYILDYLDSLRITRILITHKISSISNCDEIFFIKNGIVVANGKHQEILKTCDDYRKMCEVYE